MDRPSEPDLGPDGLGVGRLDPHRGRREIQDSAAGH